MRKKIQKLVSIIQAKIDIDIPYYLKNSQFFIVKQIIILGLGLISAMVFTRYLSVYTYGAYQFLLAIIGMASIISVPGVNTSIFSSIAKGKDGVFLPGFKLRLLWGFLGIPILLIITYYYFFIKNETNFGYAMLMLSLFFPFLSTLNMWSVLLQVKKDFKMLASFSSIQAAFTTLFLIIAVLLFKGHLLAIFITYALSQTISNAIFLKKSLSFLKNNEEEEGWKSYGYFLTKINIIAILTGRLDRILVGSLLGLEMLAIYSVGIKFANMIQNFVDEILMLTTPKIAEKNTLQLKKYIFIFISTAIASILLILLSPPLIRFLFTQRYNDSIYLSQIVLAFLPFYIILNFMAKHFKYYLKDKKIILLEVILSPLLRSLVMVILIMGFGLKGMAFAQGFRDVISIVMFIILLMYFKHK